jgi:hypothetical protein
VAHTGIKPSYIKLCVPTSWAIIYNSIQYTWPILESNPHIASSVFQLAEPSEPNYCMNILPFSPLFCLPPSYEACGSRRQVLGGTEQRQKNKTRSNVSGTQRENPEEKQTLHQGEQSETSNSPLCSAWNGPPPRPLNPTARPGAQHTDYRLLAALRSFPLVIFYAVDTVLWRRRKERKRKWK